MTPSTTPVITVAVAAMNGRKTHVEVKLPGKATGLVVVLNAPAVLETPAVRFSAFGEVE